MSITSRERILMALNHEEADRVAIDFGSSRSSGINAIAYNELKEYLAIDDGGTKVFDVKQLLAIPDKKILERMGCDVVQLHRLKPSIGLKLDRWKAGKLPADGDECLVPAGFDPQPLPGGREGIYDAQGRLIAKRPAGGLYLDETYHPLANADCEADIDALPLPDLTDEEADFLRKTAKELYETTDYALSGATSFSIFEKGTKDFGYENFLMNLYAEPEMIEYYLDRLSQAYVVMMGKYLDAVGDYVQIVQSNDDLGMQTGLLISPDLYRKFFKPRHAQIIESIKRKKKDIFVYLHCCGSIYPVMGDLIEVGFDAFNPVQTNAADMDPYRLKREFGGKCTFWGGACSTQTTMTFGSVEDVVREAQEMINVFAPGGGFVFNQVHNIQAGIAPEKVIALYDTALRCGTPSFYKRSAH